MFYQKEFLDVDFYLFSTTSNVERMTTFLGMILPYSITDDNKHCIADILLNNIIQQPWYVIFDFIEEYLSLLPKQDVFEVINQFNKIFKQENSGYQIINLHVIPITNEQEMNCLEEALSVSCHSVQQHIQKAIDNFAKRENPDYENTIKDAISAVEALCNIITGNKSETLGKTIKQLEDKGIVLHGSLKSAINSLYGYASDSLGVRHGGSEFTNISFEEAKFMLITCSAIVNFLIAQWEQAKGK